MAFSNTISTTIFTTQQMMDHAFRRAKIPPQKITREYIDTALELLYARLSHLINTGISLWAIQTDIIPMYYGRQKVVLPLGTVDVLNANLRSLNRLTGVASSSEGVAANAFDSDTTTECAQIAAGGQITLQIDPNTRVTNFGILAGASGDWAFQLQVSSDGIAYTTVYTATAQAVFDQEWFWFDVQGIQPTTYVRLLATGTTVLNVREFVVANTPQEIPMAKINRDDYMNLPNKAFLGRPVQYWYDKEIDQPDMTIWPAPLQQFTYSQLTVTVQRYIMDIGDLTQQIEVPQSWYLAILTQWAFDICLEIPEAPPEQIGILGPEATKLMAEAWSGQTDSSPTRFSPNISPYTR